MVDNLINEEIKAQNVSNPQNNQPVLSPQNTQPVISSQNQLKIYFPLQRDNVDQALAQFINNYTLSHPGQRGLQIMFLREAQGVYKYGSKRVFLKIEKSIVNVKGHKQPVTQIFVRVGGGFMQIDDFIEQYE